MIGRFQRCDIEVYPDRHVRLLLDVGHNIHGVSALSRALSDTDFLSPEYAKHSFLNRLRVFAAGFVLRRAARIRVVSERIRDSLKTKNYKLKTKPTVLPIFVDVESFRNTRTDESLAKRFAGFGTRILVVSRLESEKNVALAIRAFAKCAPKDSCLIIVGKGSEKPRLLRIAEELGVSNRVFFEGAEAPIKYYKLANLVLAPSLYEGYGMVIVEALASGVPVLSTDVGIAQETGTIVAPQEKFAELFAEDHDILEQRKKARKVLGWEPKHTWREAVDEYIRGVVSSA